MTNSFAGKHAFVSGSSRGIGAQVAGMLAAKGATVAINYRDKVVRAEKVANGIIEAGGKVHWAERFAADHDVGLDASWFYTDSYSDLPMLERVGVRDGHPIGDALLRQVAERLKSVMGDHGRLYVAEDVANAIATHLVPRATCLTPNGFELAWLTGLEAGGEEAARAFAAMMTMQKIDVAAIDAARRG